MEYQQHSTTPTRRPRPPKKPRDDHLRSCFEINSSGDDTISIICNYCNEYNKNVKKFNPTVCRTHLVMHCSGVDEDLRRVLMEGSQEFKRLKRLGEVVPTNVTEEEEENGNTTTTATPSTAATNSDNANQNGKPKPMQMKEYTQLYLHSEKRQMERHWLDMWKDCSQELSRLRKELRETTEVDVAEELEGDIAGLKKKKMEFGRLLGMNGHH